LLSKTYIFAQCGNIPLIIKLLLNLLKCYIYFKKVYLRHHCCLQLSLIKYMLNNKPPVPKHESDRILELSKLDLDYSTLEDNFKYLTRLAAKITGKPIALINLIDSFTQWTISNHGFPLKSMPREDSVCQYTIAGDHNYFEVKNLLQDERFKDKPYVSPPDGLRYYMGVPLKSEDGNSIGALCVVDMQVSELSAEQIDFLEIIADEIVNRLYELKRTHQLFNKFTAAQEEHKTLARNIREPLAGIIGILQVIIEDAGNTKIDGEVLQYIKLIEKSSNSILNLTDAVLDTDEERHLNKDQGDLIWLKTTIETLYMPLCLQKNIGFKINVSTRTERIPFSKNKLVQITGNLITYAIRSIPDFENITLDLILKVEASQNVLCINLSFLDSGTDIINKVFDKTGLSASEQKNTGVQALVLVQKMIESLNGQIETSIMPGTKRVFNIIIPQNQPK